MVIILLPPEMKVVKIYYVNLPYIHISYRYIYDISMLIRKWIPGK